MTPRQIRYDLGSPVSPSPHTRRLVSLSSVLDFSLSPESTSAETHEATQILDAILDAYSPPPDSSVRADHLISHLISLAPSPLGAQNITRQLLHFLFPPCSPSPEIPALSEILPRARIGRVNPHHCSQGVETFARDLLDLFFLPLLSAGGRTENPPSANSPTFLTTRSRAIHAPSPNRLSSLRHDLLKRDDACCVVTGYMDTSVYRRGPVPGVVTAKVEAAHIIPHALNAGDGELEEGKRFVWQVLNMFDPGVSHTLEGAQIDGTRNALLLQADLHHMWGQLLWWLEEVPVEPNTYQPVTSRRFPPSHLSSHFTTSASSGKKITFLPREGVEVPDPRLIRLHAACAKVLDASGAAEYVELMWDEAEEVTRERILREDGGSKVWALLCAKVGVWVGVN